MGAALDVSLLGDVVRDVLDDPSAVVSRWTSHELPGGVGNSSDGVFRVRGVATTNGPDRKWSLVVKRLRRDSAEVGVDAPRHPVYWRREVDAYASGLLDELPRGVAVPRCWRIVRCEGERAELWLEDLGAMDHPWASAARRDAAVHLARFHSAYLTGTGIPGYPWMAMYFARQWHDLLMPWIEPAVNAVRGTARHLAAPIAILDHPALLLDALESAPQTLCHHDPNPANLMLRSLPDGGTELVAIDWQLVGRGPIGEDLGQFLSTILAGAMPAERDRIESEVLAAYHVELMRSGVRMTLPEVHRGYYCAAALRQVSFAFFQLGEQLREVHTKERSRSAVEEFVRRMRHGHLPSLAARARALSGG